MARDIESLKKSIDRFLSSGDRSHVSMDNKTAIVRMGADLYVCDIQKGDPETCTLSQRVCEVDDETFSKIEDYVKREIENIDKFLGKSKENELIPDDTPRILTEEEKRQQKIDNELIPDDDERGKPGDDNELIPD